MDEQSKIEIEKHMQEILRLIGENPERDGLVKTPERVAKSLEFLTTGYRMEPKNVLNDALFSSTNNEMVLMINIEFYSLC